MTDSLKSKLRHALAALGLFSLAGCGPSTPLQRQQYQGGALGTSYSIILYTEGPQDFTRQIDSVFAVMNRSMSTYLPDSDISRINRGDSTVVVDAMFREVFEASGGIWEESGGHFDPTVGVLVDAWGFGPGPALEMDSLKVDSLLAFVGFDKVSLGPDNRIRKALPQVRLDFNAIAKGYSIDRLAGLFDEAGVSHYLIEVGGEVRARSGNPEKNQPWRIGIDDPQVSDGRSIKRVIALQDRSMASSGNYRKFRVDPQTGAKFVHTIDPLTGFTRSSNILAASVLAPNCMLADGYATAFMAMDLEASRKLLGEHPELEGYIIYVDADGTVKEFMTPGFEALIR